MAVRSDCKQKVKPQYLKGFYRDRDQWETDPFILAFYFRHFRSPHRSKPLQSRPDRLVTHPVGGNHSSGHFETEILFPGFSLTESFSRLYCGVVRLQYSFITGRL